MSFFNIILYAFEILAGIAALSILFVRNVFHAALLLIVCLISLAGVYVLYNAEFIAVTQILIYAGGVLVLILFAVMLTSRITGKLLIVKSQYIFPASLMCAGIASGLALLFSQQNFYNSQAQPQVTTHNSINKMGIALMSDFVLPFEIAGVLLLVVLIGAAVTASSYNIRKQ